MYTIITIYCRVKKFVTPLFIFWIIFLLDLEKLYRQTIGIPMETNCAPLVADLFFFFFFFFFFAMREISSSLSHVKIRLTLLRLSIQLQDTLMIY